MEKPSLPCWGVTVPKSIGSFLSSITEETFKCEARAPKGKGLLQAFVIGEHAGRMSDWDDEELSNQVFEEIRRLIPGIPGRFLFSRVLRRPKSMVISTPGYQRALASFNNRLAGIRGLHLISDYQTNPLIEGSVYLGERTAERLPRDRNCAGG